MAISFPLSLPSTKSPARVELQSVVSAGVSTSPFTFESQRQDFSGGYWVAGVTMPNMVRADAEQWITFLLKLRGPVGTFLMGDTLAQSARGIATGTPVVNGASQVGAELITDGWTINTTGILLAGDYIQIGQRLYKNLVDVNSDGSGNATLDIWPELRESPTDNQTIVTSSAKGLFRLAGTRNSLASQGGTTDAPIYSIAFDAIEAI